MVLLLRTAVGLQRRSLGVPPNRSIGTVQTFSFYLTQQTPFFCQVLTLIEAMSGLRQPQAAEVEEMRDTTDGPDKLKASEIDKVARVSWLKCTNG